MACAWAVRLYLLVGTSWGSFPSAKAHQSKHRKPTLASFDLPSKTLARPGEEVDGCNGGSKCRQVIQINRPSNDLFVAIQPPWGERNIDQSGVHLSGEIDGG